MSYGYYIDGDNLVDVPTLSWKEKAKEAYALDERSSVTERF